MSDTTSSESSLMNSFVVYNASSLAHLIACNVCVRLGSSNKLMRVPDLATPSLTHLTLSPIFTLCSSSNLILLRSSSSTLGDALIGLLHLLVHALKSYSLHTSLVLAHKTAFGLFAHELHLNSLARTNNDEYFCSKWVSLITNSVNPLGELKKILLYLPLSHKNHDLLPVELIHLSSSWFLSP